MPSFYNGSHQLTRPTNMTTCSLGQRWTTSTVIADSDSSIAMNMCSGGLSVDQRFFGFVAQVSLQFAISAVPLLLLHGSINTTADTLQLGPARRRECKFRETLAMVVLTHLQRASHSEPASGFHG
jgi:hypothetical protein